jgi:hypothetical protein
MLPTIVCLEMSGPEVDVSEPRLGPKQVELTLFDRPIEEDMALLVRRHQDQPTPPGLPDGGDVTPGQEVSPEK